MKEFLRSPKKMAILGLIGSVFMIINIFILILNDVCSWFTSLNFAYSIGFLIYFIIVLLRLYKEKGNIKIANYILIGSFIISLVVHIVIIQDLPGLSMASIVYLVVTIITLLYLTNILLRKIKIVNNKSFIFIIFIYLIYQAFLMIIVKEMDLYIMSELVNSLSYLLITPYFYNYYDLLKGGK